MLWTPGAGIRQDDPFSRALFVLLASVIIAIVQELHTDLHVHMYVDDLVIYVHCSAHEAGLLLQDIVHALRTLRFPTRVHISK